MKFTMLFNFFFLFTISLFHFVYALDCPLTVYVELGKDGIINCQILNNGDVYWYKGNSTKKSPIVRLENRQKKISQESDRYDIDEEGSLIIKNINEQNYGFYSVVNFYASDKHETDQIKVEIAVKPQTMCPIIAGCKDCNHCNLTEPETGNISCSIRGTRPQVHLSIVTENWINVIRNISEETYDTVTDTWSTTATIQYSEWYDCRSPLRLRCVTVTRHQFELSDSVAHVKLESCKTTTQISGYQTPLAEDTKRISIFTIAIIVVIFVVIVLMFIIVLCRKSDTCRHRKTNKGDMETQGELEPLQKTNTSDFFKILIAHLKAEYASLFSFECLLKGVYLSSEALFNGDIFTLNKMDNVQTVTSGADLIQKLFEEAGRYVFISNDGYSKKLFTQHLCSYLSDDIPNQRIILYLSLDGLHSKMSIADAIVKKLNMQGKCSVKKMQKIVQKHRCLILMDEIDKLISQEDTQGTKCEKKLGLTIGELLRNKEVFNKFPTLGCLVFVKSMIYLQPPYELVKLRHLNSDSLNLHIRSVFRYYAKERAVVDASQSDLQRGVRYNYETADTEITTSSNEEEDKAMVLATEVLKETCTTKELLKNDQMWLLLFIHVILSEITKETEEKDFDLCFYRRSCLAKMILNYLKIRYSFQPLEEISFDYLEMELGKISLETELKDAKFDDKSSLLSVYEKEEMEGLIGKNKFEAVLSCGLIHLIEDDTSTQGVASDENMCSSATKKVMFCHTFVQEYLAAQAIATTKETLEGFSSSPCWQTDERMERVIQFIFATKEDARRRLIKSFMEQKEWDILADCLFESETTDEYLDLLKLAFRPNVKYAISFDKLCNYFHRLAVLHFCKNLSHIDVVPASLTFTGNCPLHFFRQLRIPKVRFLFINEMNFQKENDFIQMLDLVQEKDMTQSLQFMKCDCPPRFSKDVLQGLVQKSSKLPKILRTETIKDAPIETSSHREGWERLNFEKGSWE